MNQPIVFLSPEEIAGIKGFQVVDDETHEVVSVIFEDGTEAPNPCSYKDANA